MPARAQGVDEASSKCRPAVGAATDPRAAANTVWYRSRSAVGVRRAGCTAAAACARARRRPRRASARRDTSKRSRRRPKWRRSRTSRVQPHAGRARRVLEHHPRAGLQLLARDARAPRAPALAASEQQTLDARRRSDPAGRAAGPGTTRVSLATSRSPGVSSRGRSANRRLLPRPAARDARPAGATARAGGAPARSARRADRSRSRRPT